MLKRTRQFRAIQPRNISTASHPYDNYTKLRAIPFKIRPKHAQIVLAPFAATVTGNSRKVLSSLGARIPFLNIDFFRPARFSAVYFPAWFVTGEVEANVTYKGVQAKESVWFDNTYIPGSHFGVLSAAPLNFLRLKKAEIVPFTTSLLHQHGEPIQCIPFSTSPFSVLDVAASHSPSRSITINEDLSIDPSSVKPNLISAYPVLLPLYLAQYEMQDGKGGINDMFTFILRAYDSVSPNTMLFENISKASKLVKTHFEESHKLLGHDFSGEVNSFVPQYSRVSIPYDSMRPNVSISIRKWLEGLLCSSNNIEILADSSLGVIGKGDEDLRMRDMALVGTSLEEYKHITKNIMSGRNLYNKWIGRNIGRSPEDTEDELKKPIEVLEKDIESLETGRDLLAPVWWWKWLILNRPNSEIAKQWREENAAASGTHPPKDSDKV